MTGKKVWLRLNSGRIGLLLLMGMFFLWMMTKFSFPDLFAMSFVPYQLFAENIYTFVRTNKSACVWLDATFPPLYYLVMGTYLQVLTFITVLPVRIFDQAVCPVWELLTNQVLLFWIKFPMVLAHLGAGLVYTQFFTTQKWRMFLLWVLNPVLLFVTLIEGQFDIFVAFFILLSLWLLRQKKWGLAFLCLGLGGAMKHFPFLLMPLWLAHLNETWWRKILFAGIALVPYGLALLLLYSPDLVFYMTTFSENTKMLGWQVEVGSIRVSVYLLAYLLVILAYMRKGQRTFIRLILYGFLLVGLYFATTRWFVQRLVWLMPFLLLLLPYMRKRRLIGMGYLSYFGYVLFGYPGLFDHTLTRPSYFAYLKEFKVSVLPWLSETTKEASYWLMTGFMLIWVVMLLGSKREKNSMTVEDIAFQFMPLVVYLLFIFSPIGLG